MDEIARANEQLWEGLVKEGNCGYTIPWLDLTAEGIEGYVNGRVAFPRYLHEIYPRPILSDVDGQDVLCLASGGGQQSAVFGLLGSTVTVVDLTQGQLDGDLEVARHHGFDVRTIKADMRDLSSLEPESFDLVYQGNSIAYVPDVRKVFVEVSRILRNGGRYRVDFQQSAIAAVEWNGSDYVVTRSCEEREHHREDGGIEFRHDMSDIFNGLIENGFNIEGVYDRPFHLSEKNQPEPGSWTHQESYVAGSFAVVSRKQ